MGPCNGKGFGRKISGGKFLCVLSWDRENYKRSAVAICPEGYHYIRCEDLMGPLRGYFVRIRRVDYNFDIGSRYLRTEKLDNKEQHPGNKEPNY